MFEIDSKIIDADLLLDRVKITAKMRDIDTEFYSASGIDNKVSMNMIRQSLMRTYQYIQMMNATRIIGEKPIVSNRPVIGWVIVFCKRVFRKLTRWLFQSYYQQQNSYNEAAVKTLTEMIKIQESLILAFEAYTQRRENDAN